MKERGRQSGRRREREWGEKRENWFRNSDKNCICSVIVTAHHDTTILLTLQRILFIKCSSCRSLIFQLASHFIVMMWWPVFTIFMSFSLLLCYIFVHLSFPSLSLSPSVLIPLVLSSLFLFFYLYVRPHRRTFRAFTVLRYHLLLSPLYRL